MQVTGSEMEKPADVPFSTQLSWPQVELRSRPFVAIVIPALQEGHTITRVISKLSAMVPEAAIVVVDGGSSDGTAEKAQRAMVNVVHESKRGYGRAIKSGIESVTANLYAIVDADDTYDLSLLPKMPDLANQGKLVIGRRESASDGGMSLSHRIGNQVLSLFYRLLFGQKVADTQSGFKVFPGRIASALRQEGMSLSSEILVVGRLLGYNVAEVPVGYQMRHSYSKSKFGFWRDGIPVLLFLLSSRLKKLPKNGLESQA